MLGLLAYNLFFLDGVSATQNMPQKLEPGKDYTIEVTVHKGNLGGFARLQQDFPAGVQLQPVSIGNATFAFSGTTLKMIWTSLPSDQDFKISYKVTVPATTAAALGKPGNGKFSYVLDNTKQTVDITDAASSGLAANNATNATNSTATASSGATGAQDPTNGNAATGAQAQLTSPGSPAGTSGATTSSGLSCERSITKSANGDILVTVIIHRSGISGFCKLQENLPPGIAATSVQNANASFNFSDMKVKWVWIQLPQDNDIKVVYKLTGTPKGNQIDGTLSYLENDATKKYTISPTSFPTNTDNAADQTLSSKGNTATPNQAANGAQASATTVDKGQQTAAASKTNAQQVNQGNQAQNRTNENTLEKTKAEASKKEPNANAQVNFKVQICALRKMGVDATYFSSRFALAQVGTELHEGWTKYTTGGATNYKDARDLRENVKNKGVQNPFVTAYNQGRRITVQEALMITNQKWFK